MKHLFISFKHTNYQDAIAYLHKKHVGNIRLVNFDVNSQETIIEADVPLAFVKTLIENERGIKGTLKNVNL